MRGRTTAVLLSLCVLLSSCSSLLDRSYSSVTPHLDKPSIAEDPSVLRVENYRELVQAVLYLVNQGAQEGTIRFYDYPGDPAAALTAACAEVHTQDPLAAYAVDAIRQEVTRVVSHYEGRLAIEYRRTQEQVQSIARVTGTGAIRGELRRALGEYASEVLLRVTYFSENEVSLARLIRQVYYSDPLSALGLPQAEIHLYPDTGRDRVVEILLTYPDRDLNADRTALSQRVQDITADWDPQTPEEALTLAARETGERADYDPQGPDNPLDTLREGKGNSEGLALTFALLLDAAREDLSGLACRVGEGFRKDTGEARFWNVVTVEGRTLYYDPVLGEDSFFTEEEFFDLGYRWEGGPQEPEETSQENPDSIVS